MTDWGRSHARPTLIQVSFPIATSLSTSSFQTPYVFSALYIPPIPLSFKLVMLVLSALATFFATVLLASASPVEPATPLLRAVDLHARTDAAALCKPCADLQATTKACAAIAGKNVATLSPLLSCQCCPHRQSKTDMWLSGEPPVEASCLCSDSYFLKVSSCLGCLSVSDPKLYNQTRDFPTGAYCRGPSCRLTILTRVLVHT